MLEPNKIHSDKDILDFFLLPLKDSVPLSRQPREVRYYAKANGWLNLWSTKQPNTVMRVYVEELMNAFATAGESKIFSVPYVGRFTIFETVIFSGHERSVHTPEGMVKVIDDPIDHLPFYKVTFNPTFRVMSNRGLFNKYANNRKINKFMLPEISRLGKPLNFYAKQKTK